MADPVAELEDSEAIVRAQQGDHEAFRVLVERYQGRAFGLALRIMKDPDLARDAVQDAFLKAYTALDRFEGRSGFYTWLYRLVFNQCIDMKRRDKSGGHVEWDDEVARDVAPEAQQGALGRFDPGEGALRTELRQALGKAIESLPEDARRTLVMREIDGLSYVEIAEALGIPKGTVMSRLHYARKKMQELLIESGVVGSGSEESQQEAERK